MVWKRTFAKDEYEKGIPLCTELLKELFQKGKVVTDVLKYLQDKRYIVKVKQHQQGVHSSLFKLHPSIETQLVYQIEFLSLDSSLIKKLNHRQQSQLMDIKQLNIIKKNIKLNEEGIKYLEAKYGKLPESRRDILIAVQRTDLNLLGYFYGDFFAVRPDSKSRTYSNLTQTQRTKRKLIDFNGASLKMTDISNSQVLLCIPIIIEKMKALKAYHPDNLPPDFILFKTLCEEGKIYDYLLKCSNFSGSRNEFKQQFFKEVFFCRNSKQLPPIKKAFVNQFPTIFHYITLYKQFNHANFATALQEFEASIMIDSVFYKMQNEGKIVLTLHDAIICSNYEDLKYAELLIEKELSSYNLKPTFKRELE
ncbi:hypothetical protein [Mucilaginibacter sp. SP1R1]|uniref:hypothetical protein n=1 Tax=Mucilaginibacter sp. SP1R1 TaxID=2723091 RepID=UPI003AFFAD5F